MPKLIKLPTFKSSSGQLSVLEKKIPFKIKRCYFIYNLSNQRGGHRHKKTKQAMVCVNGSCKVVVKNKKNTKFFLLNNPNKCLMLDPQDWHKMYNFEKSTVLLVIASHKYNKNDYIYNAY